MAVESDGDRRIALTSFAEVAADYLSVKHCMKIPCPRECMEVLLQRDDRVEQLKPQHPSKKRLASSTNSYIEMNPLNESNRYTLTDD